MKKTETIEAIDKLIEEYRTKTHSSSSCSLCNIRTIRFLSGSDCNNCINSVFKQNKSIVFCLERSENYRLSYSDKRVGPNLVKYWTSVKHFLSPLEEEIDINDIKEHILELAKPYKK